MKFAKELEEQAVPEWKTRYLDYKKGKKKLKAVARAVRELDSKSLGPSRAPTFTSPFSSLRDAPVKSLLRRSPLVPNGRSAATNNAPLSQTRSRSETQVPQRPVPAAEGDVGDATPRAGGVRFNERSPLRSPEHNAAPRMTRYGSIIGSPPQQGDSDVDLRPASTLELPMPIMDPEYDRPLSPGSEPGPASEPLRQDMSTQPQVDLHPTKRPQQTPSESPKHTKQRTAHQSRYTSLLRRSLQRSASTSGEQSLVTRVFSFSGRESPGQAQNQSHEIALEEYRELDMKRNAFFLFLDEELSKIGVFYKEMEDEVTERLKLLRSQLHTMRYWRLQDIQHQSANHHNTNHRHLSTIANVGQDKIGKTSRSMAQLGSPSLIADNGQVERGNVAAQDYQRSHAPIKYQSAKGKLKRAMQELYRALELLKSYSTLNQTAFRKIVKKYNKAVDKFGRLLRITCVRRSTKQTLSLLTGLMN